MEAVANPRALGAVVVAAQAHPGLCCCLPSCETLRWQWQFETTPHGERPPRRSSGGLVPPLCCCAGAQPRRRQRAPPALGRTCCDNAGAVGTLAEHFPCFMSSRSCCYGTSGLLLPGWPRGQAGSSGCRGRAKTCSR